VKDLIIRKKPIFVIVLLILIANLYANENVITVFHAGSLSYPFKMISESFTKKTGIKVFRESAGSRGIIRRITELGKKADILASADYKLIETMMFPDYADFYYKFATNEIVIAISSYSKWVDEINNLNWYKIIQNKGFIIAHSDPELDPCGYRSLMVLQLAEKLYNLNGFYSKINKKIGSKWIRPKSVQLTALLESGELDGAFEYRSVALQHRLNFVKLPDKINLGSMEYNDFYRKAKVELSGKEPGKKSIIYGQPIVYGVTIPKNTNNLNNARKFLNFVFSKKGMEILKQSFQKPLNPAIKVNYK